MELKHIKLTNGSDLLCVLEDVDDENETVTISYPIEMVIDPHLGTYGKKWLAFSENEVAIIDSFNVLFIHPASDSAAQLYLDIIARSASDVDEDLEFFDETTATVH